MPSVFDVKLGRRWRCDFEQRQFIQSRGHCCAGVGEGYDKMEGRAEAVQSDTRSSDNAHAAAGGRGAV